MSSAKREVACVLSPVPSGRRPSLRHPQKAEAWGGPVRARAPSTGQPGTRRQLPLPGGREDFTSVWKANVLK